MGLKSNSGHFYGTNGFKSGYLKLNIQLFASKIKTPVDPKMISMNPEKQIRHIGVPSIDSDKSKLFISLNEAKTLIKKVSGTGTMVSPYQEIVDCGKVIGFVEVGGKLVPTTKVKIHYSKTGSHIVPYRGKERKR